MFRCFYHAWAFDLQGKLVNRPGTERYAEGSNVDGVHNLVQVPQLDQYRGLYFVNYDRNAVDLVTYLAGATEFLDLVMDQSEVGMEIVGGTQEYGFAANWKLLCENSIDGYHGMPTHATYFDYVMASGGQLGENLTTVNKPNDLGNGHAVIEYGAPWGRPVAKPVKAWGETRRRRYRGDPRATRRTVRQSARGAHRVPEPQHADFPEPRDQRHHGGNGADVLSGGAGATERQRVGAGAEGRERR